MAQPMTRRVKTSRTATRYNQPWPVRTPVASVVPNLVGPFDGETLKPVGRDRSAVAAVGGSDSILGALPGEEALLAHEAGDAVAPSRAAQRMSQPRAAVGLTTAGKLLECVGAVACSPCSAGRSAGSLLPIIVAAARDQKGLITRRLCIGHSSAGFGLPLGGASERMPSDCFKTSRCSKVWRSPHASAGSRLRVLRRSV